MNVVEERLSTILVVTKVRDRSPLEEMNALRDRLALDELEIA